LKNYDTAILDSVWRTFEKLAAEFPDDKDVVMTLQYHRWYSRQCTILAQRTESPQHKKTNVSRLQKILDMPGVRQVVAKPWKKPWGDDGG
jgi:hypothetical protein